MKKKMIKLLSPTETSDKIREVGGFCLDISKKLYVQIIENHFI